MLFYIGCVSGGRRLVLWLGLGLGLGNNYAILHRLCVWRQEAGTVVAGSCSDAQLPQGSSY